jgi:hypothetical protein
MSVSKANFVQVKLWFEKLVDQDQTQQSNSINRLESESVLNQEQIIFLKQMLNADSLDINLGHISSKSNMSLGNVSSEHSNLKIFQVISAMLRRNFKKVLG